MHSNQKGDYGTMRKDALRFAKKKYFSGHSDARSVQGNFNLLISFVQDSVDKHSISRITPEIRRKIRRRN